MPIRRAGLASGGTRPSLVWDVAAAATLFTGVAPYRARERGVVMTTAMGVQALSVIKAYQQRTWASGNYAVVAARIVLASDCWPTRRT